MLSEDESNIRRDIPFKAKLNYLMPVVAVLALATLFAFILSLGYGSPPFFIAPFTDAYGGPALNALYFVAMVAGIGSVFYLIMKTRLAKMLTLVVVAVYVILTFTLTSIYLPPSLWLVGLWDLYFNYLAVIAIQLAIITFTIYAVFIHRKRLQAPMMLLVSASLGALLGFLIPTFSTIAILIGLAAYDILAVFKGPLGKMASKLDVAPLTGLILSYGELKIGLGDLVFYSMLSSHTLIFLGTVPFFAAVAGILAGVYLSFKMLEEKLMFPGLPFALTMGIGFAFATNYLQYCLS